MAALFVATFGLLISDLVASDDQKKKLHAKGTLSTNTEDDSSELSVGIRIAEEINSIELVLSGPSDAYFAVGFGSSVMVDTWSVVIAGDGQDDWFEQTLSNHRAGLQRRDKTFIMVQSQYIPHTHRRSVTLQASLSAMHSFHPFHVDDYEIDVIWAIGRDHNFVEHVKYGTQTLIYVIDDSGTPSTQQNTPLINFSELTTSALIVVFGMMLLAIILAVYWLWRFCKYLRGRVEIKEMESAHAHAHEKDALLAHRVNVAANPDFQNNHNSSGSSLLAYTLN